MNARRRRRCRDARGARRLEQTRCAMLTSLCEALHTPACRVIHYTATHYLDSSARGEIYPHSRASSNRTPADDYRETISPRHSCVSIIDATAALRFSTFATAEISPKMIFRVIPSREFFRAYLPLVRGRFPMPRVRLYHFGVWNSGQPPA